MNLFKVVLLREKVSSADSSDPSDGDGVSPPAGWRSSHAHLQIGIAGGTSVTYQASLWGRRTIIKSDGRSETTWLRLFQTPAGQDKSAAWLVYGAAEYDRLEILLDAVAGTSPDINTAVAFSGA